MELRRYDDVREFYARAEGFLVAHEAHHNLILGVCATLLRTPGYYEQPPYLATVEEGGEVVAAAVRTPPHNLVLSRTSSDEVLTLIGRDAFALYDALPGALAPADVSRPFAELWAGLSGQPYERGKAMRIFQLEAVEPVPQVPGELRRATEADRELLLKWLLAFQEEAIGETDPSRAEDWAERAADARLRGEVPAAYFWVSGGEPVSLAGCGGPTPSGIRIGPVYTPPERRRKGYAGACVAALSGLLLERGYRYCFLFTDLANPTANHIYREIGYRPVCDVDEYLFTAR